ncbi:MAG: response regulator, partial [Desulfovibrio sp.]|nr:response regulator [Desulfovibrio sp.]
TFAIIASCIVSMLLGGVLVYQSRDSMKSLLEQRMLDITNTAAAMLDGDALEKLRAEDKDTPPYQDALAKLRFFQDNMRFNLKYIYGIRDMGDGTFTFTIDPTVADPGEFGGPIVATDALRTAAKGTPCVDETPYEDKWGRFYSAYSPVFDSKGRVSGIIAVDFDAAWYEEQANKQTFAIIASCIVSMLLGALIVLLVTISLRRRFKALTADVNELSSGIDSLLEEIDLPAGAPDKKGRDGKEGRDAKEGMDVKDGGDAKDGMDAGNGDEIGLLSGRIRSMRESLQSYLRHAQSQAYGMIAALSADYRSVYFVDLDNDTGVCFRQDPEQTSPLYAIKEGDSFSFRQSFEQYAQHYIAESYRKGFLRLFEPGYAEAACRRTPVISYRYVTTRTGKETYELVRVACTGPRQIGVSFSDVDAETRRAMEQSQALREALASAEDASRAKTAFLSSMSHEIRTPMNAIIGLDSIALSEPDLAPSTRSHLERIGSSARHLLSLINDILDMSRIESGRLTIASAEFPFSSLLEQVSTMIGGQCQEKGLEYRCEVKGHVRDYYIGDAMKLKQVLINILGNAVKFTPEGGTVSLDVEQTASFQDKATLRFVIRDTGIGMDKDFLPKLFKPFSQEDSSTTSKYGSTGLGLAITKNIVELMHGKIEVASEKGKGTVFTVAVTLAESSRTLADDAGDAFDPKDLKVLVVDDDAVASEHARLVLDEVGVEAETAASGPEALEKVRLRRARQDPYSLILMDWKMPGMDGLAASKQIRSLIGDQSVIIFLTAYNWDDVKDEAKDAGVDSFLSKPLFAGTVIEEFRKTLASRNHSRSEAADPEVLRGRRLLLAEDNELNAEIIQMLLQMRDMQVDIAANGRLCVEKFAASPEWHYDAILMDMRMPEMDGLQATEAIRGLKRDDAGRIPIIALTANAFNEDVMHSLQSGLNAHLSKPVEPEMFYKTLSAFLSR